MKPAISTCRMKLSIIIPCYNEENTLKRCVERVLAISDHTLELEIIIVDDCSTDQSVSIAKNLAVEHGEISVFYHERNRGKGAALRTGIQKATGDIVAIQDADLEYDPQDLRRLIVPIRNNEADAVMGSRFLSSGAHRVLYFWHSLANRFLTFLSNMFTDLNLTDMETCYKVFRRDIIQRINIEEDRFGFEPEIVAKLAQMRVRVFEMGISYYGRTYVEGKKISARDGVRATYCILHYNAHKAPLAVQFVLYLIIGGLSAVVNAGLFLALFAAGVSVMIAAPAAFVVAAFLNYLLCICVLFRHRARWNSRTELAVFISLIGCIGFLDLQVTRWLLALGASAAIAKVLASVVGLGCNFLGKRFIVFSESPRGPWRPQGAKDIAQSRQEEAAHASRKAIPAHTPDHATAISREDAIREPVREVVGNKRS